MNDKSKYDPKIHHRRSIRLKGYDYSQAGAYFITICCADMECRFGKIENNAMILNEFGQIAFDEWMKLPERYGNFELDTFQIMPNHLHGIVVLVGATLAVAQNENDMNDIRVEVNDNWAGVNDIRVEVDDNWAGVDDIRAGVDDIRVEVNDNWAGVDDIRAGVNPAPTTTQPHGSIPTVGDMMGAYKSLVANECLKIWKSRWARGGARSAPTMGKIWQRNYYEHIIRNEQAYKTISHYVINNPSSWKEDKFYK